jgi:hypothetical protein
MYTLTGVLTADEGTILGNATELNFVGAGVTAALGADGVLTVTIPGGGGGGSPSLPFTSVQFNNAGSFGGSQNFTWNGTGLVVTDGAGVTDTLSPGTLLFTTAGTGTVSVKTAGGGDGPLNLDILDLQVNGASGAAGQVLTSNGPGASPTWAAVPAASGWTDGGTAVYLTTSTDDVSIGSNTPVTNRKLSVYNTGTDLGVSVVTLASTDNVMSTFVSGEANIRYGVDGSGITSWGAGGASAPDLRIRRSGTSTLTVDNGGAGSVAVNPGGDGVGSVGSASLRWLDIVSNTFRSFPSAGAANASASLGSGFVKLGAGGATALDTAITRTGTATLTVDNNAGGSAVLIVKGITNTQQRIHGALSKAVADSPYTTAATDEMIFWNCVGGNCTQNLPTPVGALGRTLIVKRIDTSANTLTLTPAAGQIEGAASYVVLGGVSRASVTLMSDNANWWII